MRNGDIFEREYTMERAVIGSLEHMLEQAGNPRREEVQEIHIVFDVR
jgi:hypothetical protein